MTNVSHILRFARPTHTCKLWFALLNTFTRHTRQTMSAEEAEGRMSSLYADKGRTALHENIVDTHPPFDLLVIVPVYNAERFIAQCVQSVMSQHTQYNVKAVFINDGSTDSSLNLLRLSLEKWTDDDNARAKNDNVTPIRAGIIDQPNRGVSAARNAALRHIDARYVMFVDADDILPANTFQHLLDVARKTHADVVEGTMNAFTDEELKGPTVVSHTDNEDTRHISGYACGKLIRSTLLRHIAFPEGYRYEDTILSFLVFPQARRMATTATTTYLYRQHADSFTSAETTHNPAILDAYWVARQMMKDAIALGLMGEKNDRERNNGMGTNTSSAHIQAEIYDAFLHGMKLSGARLLTLGDDVCQAYFAAMCHLAATCFEGCHSHQYRQIDKAVHHHDFTRYILASQLL